CTCAILRRCVLACLFLVFLYCSGDPLELHSFPTRRSSDLGRARGCGRRSRPERPCRVRPARNLSAALNRPPPAAVIRCPDGWSADRKSTRLNSSHVSISYAVFCLKKKKENKTAVRAHIPRQ